MRLRLQTTSEMPLVGPVVLLQSLSVIMTTPICAAPRSWMTQTSLTLQASLAAPRIVGANPSSNSLSITHLQSNLQRPRLRTSLSSTAPLTVAAIKRLMSLEAMKRRCPRELKMMTTMNRTWTMKRMKLTSYRKSTLSMKMPTRTMKRTTRRIMKTPAGMTRRSTGRESWRPMRRSMKVTTNSDIYLHPL